MATLLLALMNTAEHIAMSDDLGHTLGPWRHLNASQAVAICTVCRRTVVADGLAEEQYGMQGKALSEVCTSLTV